MMPEEKLALVADMQDAMAALDWDDALPPKSKRRPELGYVYFIGGDCECVKIGFAKDPRQRLRTLQTGSPVRLYLLATVAADPVHEKEYHQKFRADWSHGEWFRKSPKLLGLIDGLKRQENYERQKRGLSNAPSIAA